MATQLVHPLGPPDSQGATPFLPVLETLEDRCVPSTLTVTGSADDVPQITPCATPSPMLCVSGQELLETSAQQAEYEATGGITDSGPAVNASASVSDTHTHRAGTPRRQSRGE